MLYDITEYLSKLGVDIPGMGLFGYLSFRAIAAFTLALLISIFAGRKIIAWLQKKQIGETIRDLGLEGQMQKKGTPTMGGVIIFISLVIPVLLLGDLRNIYTILLLVSTVWFFLVGFADDYIKVVKKRNLGLTEIQKTVPQIVLIVAYLVALYMNGLTYMKIPFVGAVDLKWFFWIFGIAVIYGAVNAVNFTDGVDGLCASVTSTAAIAFCIAALMTKFMGISVLAAALAGGCLGYLIWNYYPSKVMMGDTGSMFLGGMVVALAYAIDCPLILVFFGIIYVIEALSDVLQIGYFKLTHGKRIFKMAPIHHHFEMCGWKERKIVTIFSLVNILGCVIGLALYYYGIINK